MSTLTTFSRFLELPAEIQSQIWRYAATPDGTLKPDSYDLEYMHRGIMLGRNHTLEQTFFHTIAPHAIHLWTPDAFYLGDAHHGLAIAEARLALIATCSTARLITLKMWRRMWSQLRLPFSNIRSGISSGRLSSFGLSY